MNTLICLIGFFASVGILSTAPGWGNPMSWAAITGVAFCLFSSVFGLLADRKGGGVVWTSVACGVFALVSVGVFTATMIADSSEADTITINNYGGGGGGGGSGSGQGLPFGSEARSSLRWNHENSQWEAFSPENTWYYALTPSAGMDDEIADVMEDMLENGGNRGVRGSHQTHWNPSIGDVVLTRWNVPYYPINGTHNSWEGDGDADAVAAFSVSDVYSWIILPKDVSEDALRSRNWTISPNTGGSGEAAGSFANSPSYSKLSRFLLVDGVTYVVSRAHVVWPSNTTNYSMRLVYNPSEDAPDVEWSDTDPGVPTPVPTAVPTAAPTAVPTDVPTAVPTAVPTPDTRTFRLVVISRDGTISDSDLTTTRAETTTLLHEPADTTIDLPTSAWITGEGGYYVYFLVAASAPDITHVRYCTPSGTCGEGDELLSEVVGGPSNTVDYLGVSYKYRRSLEKWSDSARDGSVRFWNDDN